MNCRTCGNPLTTGIAFCPSCGTATPYNTAGQGAAPPSYDPTIVATPYGNPPTPASAPANPYTNPPPPYTAYGGSGTPSSLDPYSAAPPPPYPGSTPSAQNQYAPPAMPGNYGYPPPVAPGYQPGVQPGMYGMMPPPKRKSKVGLIVGIILVVSVVLCGGVITLGVIGSKVADNGTGTPTVSSGTPTGTTGDAPTSSNIVPAAALIITNAQTSSAVDTKTGVPTKVATSFASGSDIYVAFQIDSQGKKGYTQVKWYGNGSMVYSQILPHNPDYGRVYFSYSYDTASNGTVAVYWCTQANCSDSQLAQIVTFTVTSTASVPTHTTTTALLQDQDRRAA